jgi:hypothetical protein
VAPHTHTENGKIMGSNQNTRKKIMTVKHKLQIKGHFYTKFINSTKSICNSVEQNNLVTL